MPQKNKETQVSFTNAMLFLIVVLLLCGLMLIMCFSMIFYQSFQNAAYNNYPRAQLRVPDKIKDKKIEMNNIKEMPVINPEDLIDLEDATKNLKDSLEPNQGKLFNK